MPIKRQPITNACGQEITDQDRNVTIKEATQIVGKSSRTIDSMVNNFQFPPKHNTSPGRVAFWLSELEEWKKLGCHNWYERYGKQHSQQVKSQKNAA